jgi:single-strand DNA-binding protein
MGNLGQEPEIRMTQSNLKVATYSLAVTREFSKDKEKQITDWFNVVAWGKQADLVEECLHKGNSVVVMGCFQTRSYENKEGKKVTVTEFKQDYFGIIPRSETHESGSTFADSELPF